ncbi:MAG: glycogen debranching enzyme, partial [Cyanobacteria bacterium Co-bin8]|nr:glycogen debranching enzyme [Cyanobacteria bacterium Co-bin8]
ERGRTQKGNNNTYCQDNDLSWFHWEGGQPELLEFTRRLIHFRQQHPVFCRRHWFQGREIHGSGVSDIGWFNPDGSKISDQQWHDDEAKAIAVFLNGKEIPDPNPRGERVVDDSFLLLFNAQAELEKFIISPLLAQSAWQQILDTKDTTGFFEPGRVYQPDQGVPVAAHSLVLLRCLP